MTRFVAEVSSNHNRDLGRAIEFIDVASGVGCTAVKFQLFKVDQLFSEEVLNRSAEHAQRKAWELPLEFLPELSRRCKDRGIQFSCTPFYLDAVRELEPYVDFYKIASYELLWDAVLEACAQTGKPVVLSTGMATLNEVERAVSVLRGSGCENLTLLHCTSAYPTPPGETNLAAIRTLREATGCEVGWSDHTRTPGVIFRAIHRWDAKLVEFHLDLEGDGDEFAAGHCWLPQEIAYVIRQVRLVDQSDGTGDKNPVPSEIGDRQWRADPSDGLRPMREVRDAFNPND